MVQRLRFRLKQPYDVDWVLRFLARRAVPGLESVVGDRWERAVPGGIVQVRIKSGVASVSAPSTLERADVARRVRAVLDLDSRPAAVDAALATEPTMARLIAARPGLRVPGAWDVYELAVRAILGQQVSVERATRLTIALVERFGSGDGATKAFPEPALLARVNPSELGLPGTRGRAIRLLAAAFERGELDRTTNDVDRLRATLLSIPGIGPWTTEYIAMRGGRDPDAFPASDWVVLKELSRTAPRAATAARASARAEAWRPYRAYAVMYLWAAAARRKADDERRERAGTRTRARSSQTGRT